MYDRFWSIVLEPAVQRCFGNVAGIYFFTISSHVQDFVIMSWPSKRADSYESPTHLQWSRAHNARGSGIAVSLKLTESSFRALGPSFSQDGRQTHCVSREETRSRYISKTLCSGQFWTEPHRSTEPTA